MIPVELIWYGVLGLAGLFALVTLYLAFFTVEQQTAAIVERLGKFIRIARPGLNFKIPFIDQVAGDESLRVQQLDVEVQTKTRDNVFVTVVVAVQYQVMPDRVYEAFYKLDNPDEQITAYVFDVVRASIPKMDLDDVFEKKDEVAISVKSQLEATMAEFGFDIVRALVTDIDPAEEVKKAMNDINAAQRARVAASERGEADRILKVKAAEAESQSKKLQGEGIAAQRRAIVDGLRESVHEFQTAVAGATPQDVMALVLMTQYFDTLKELGANANTNTVLIPHSPGSLTDLQSQIRNAMITADRMAPDKMAETTDQTS